MNGKVWTKEEVDILVKMYPDHPAREIAEILGRSTTCIYNKTISLGLRASKEKIKRLGSLNAKHPRSIEQRFTKGHVPFNKGKKMPPEVYAKVQRTMFKKGNRCINHREVGSERINKGGYIEIKVAEPNRWRLKHRVVWEEAHGKIPGSHNVQFKNNNHQDCSLENLYLISKREQLTTQNSIYAKYPQELREIIHLKGVVNRAIHKIERNGK